MDGHHAPWRDTMRPVRFYFMDARLLTLLVLWLFVPAWWTTAAVVVAVAALRVAEARGYRLHAALRVVRARSAGERPALHARRVRRFVDFG
ncbi:MAG: IcmT/TraK family protein [Rhodospirillales bacterium]|nr:IcmT/TraK family protein [Rhodospirillales bacterium]